MSTLHQYQKLPKTLKNDVNKPTELKPAFNS